MELDQLPPGDEHHTQVYLKPGAIRVSLEPGAICVNLKSSPQVYEDRAVRANLHLRPGAIRVNFQHGAILVNLQPGARRVNLQPGAVRVSLLPEAVRVNLYPDNVQPGDVRVNLEPGAVCVNLQTDNVSVQPGAVDLPVHVNLEPGAVQVNLQPDAVRMNLGPCKVKVSTAADHDAVHVNLEHGAVRVYLKSGDVHVNHQPGMNLGFCKAQLNPSVDHDTVHSNLENCAVHVNLEVEHDALHENHKLGNVQVILDPGAGRVNIEAAPTYVKLLCACMIVFLVIIVIVAAKMGLLIARYSVQGEICELNETTQDGRNSLPDNFRTGYIFTVVMWAIINLLRVIEYVVLGIATLNFIYTYPRSVQIYLDTLKKNLGKVIKFTLELFVLLGPYLLLVIAVPSFNIVKELEYEKMLPCYNQNLEYFSYTAVNYLRYLCAFSVRVAFVITTVIIREIWRETLKSIPLDVGHNNGGILAEWNNTAEHLQFWTGRYRGTGEVVKQIMKVFQTWFMIPWLIFFIISSLDVRYTLQPWSDESGSTMARISYLVFDINQLTGLLLPFLCATLINSYHRDFYKGMKERLIRDRVGASEQAIAHVQFNIDKEEEFDFIARIPCTEIEIRVDSPIFLLLGFFFTISKPLFS